MCDFSCKKALQAILLNLAFQQHLLLGNTSQEEYVSDFIPILFLQYFLSI